MNSTAAAWGAFDLVRRPWMALRVRTHLAGTARALPEGRWLLVANHESFWDGFLLRDVQRSLGPGRSFHAVMLDRELGPRPWLRALGALGVTPGSLARSRALVASVETLPDDAVLAFFPQGRIRPGSPRPLDFQTGIAALCRRIAPVAVLPVGLRVVTGRTARAEAYVCVGEPVAATGRRLDTPGLEEAVTAQVDAVDDFLARYGEDAPEMWPGPDGFLEPARPEWFQTTSPTWASRN